MKIRLSWNITFLMGYPMKARVPCTYYLDISKHEISKIYNWNCDNWFQSILYLYDFNAVNFLSTVFQFFDKENSSIEEEIIFFVLYSSKLALPKPHSELRRVGC